MRVITFSTHFPSTHPRKGQPTFFVEKIWQGLSSFPLMPDEIDTPDPRLEEHLKNHDTKFYDPKWHTIRAGNRWKAGDWFSPRIWSGKPYRSEQIQFSLPIQIKKIWEFEAFQNEDSKFIYFKIDDVEITDYEAEKLCTNDGLEYEDFLEWFNVTPAKPFIGQIIGWNENVKYKTEYE